MANELDIRTPPHRGSFCNLIKPQIQKGEDGKETEKWGYSLLLSKTDPKTAPFLKDLKAKIDAAILDKFGKKLIQDKMPHYPIIDGDEPDAEGETREEHAGHWVVRVSGFRQPNVIFKDGSPITKQDDAYSGAWYVAVIRPRAWDNEKGGKGVSLTPLAAIKMRDDEPFAAGGIDATEAFADLIGVDEETPAAAKPASKGKTNSGKGKAPSEDDDPLAGL